MTASKRTYGWLIALLLCCAVSAIRAQEFYVDSIRPTTIHTIQAHIDGYVAGFYYPVSSSIYTATQNVHNETYHVCSDTRLGAGLSASIYSTNLPFLRFNCSLGYRYLRYNYIGDFFSNAGIHTHWLTSEWKMELSASWIGLETGFGVDGLLGHKIVDKDHFSYVGFHSDCLNKMTVTGLFGLFFPLGYCRFEMLLSAYIIPPMDMQKMAYYNLTSSTFGTLSIEFRFSFPLFTTFSNNPFVKKGEI